MFRQRRQQETEHSRQFLVAAHGPYNCPKFQDAHGVGHDVLDGRAAFVGVQAAEWRWAPGLDVMALVRTSHEGNKRVKVIGRVGTRRGDPLVGRFLLRGGGTDEGRGRPLPRLGGLPGRRLRGGRPLLATTMR